MCPGVVWRSYIVLALALHDAPAPISVTVALVLTLTNSGGEEPAFVVVYFLGVGHSARAEMESQGSLHFSRG